MVILSLASTAVLHGGYSYKNVRHRNGDSVLLLGCLGGLPQWLASRTADQGVPDSRLDGSPFVVALSKSHLPPA